MTEIIQFAIFGLGLGAVYALLGSGLVLIYRGSGVLNFAHGAFAMASAYLFYELNVTQGWPVVPAFLLAVALITSLGVLTQVLVMRPLRGASPLSRLIATLGLLLLIQGVATLKYKGTFLQAPHVFSTEPIEIGTFVIPRAQLIMVLIAILLTVALDVASRRSLWGLAMTAVAESERTTAILGWSPDRVAMVTWGLGAALAGASGILIAQLSGLSVSGLTLTIVAAMATSLVGGFISFRLTLVVGLAIGMLQSVAANEWPDVTGLNDALPFFVIVLVLAFRGNSVPVRAHLFERLPMLGTGVVRWKTTGLAVAVMTTLFLWFLDPAVTAAITVQLVVGLVLLGVVVVTGYAGQLSLAPYAIAGIGAFFSGRLAAETGAPFVLALVVGVVGAFLVGLVFGLLALRTRGVSLAVATAGLALAVHAMLFNNSDYTGGIGGTNVGGASILGLDLNALVYPERYAVFCLVVYVMVTIGVANLRRGRAGRRMIAVRANERAAASLGIKVTGAKLWAFAISSGITGLGGTLIGYANSTILYTQFNPITSINVVAWATVGGIGAAIGPLLGAGLAPGGLVGYYLNAFGSLSAWLTIIAGLSVLLVLIQNPDGVAQGIADGKTDPVARYFAKRRRRKAAEAAAAAVRSPRRERSGPPHKVRPAELVVRGLTVRYGQTTAVSDLDVVVKPGEVVGLVGPNGAGKTTVIDAISGFKAPSSGTIELGGTGLSGRSSQDRTRAGITRSFQSVELFEDLTVRENLLVASDRRDNLAYLTSMVRPGQPRLPEVALAAVEAFEIEELLDQKPSDISDAHRRLVGIARAAATQPSVLLLDEPAAGFDQQESANLGVLIKTLAQQWGIGILLVEHDMSLVMSVCDRVLVMDFGAQIAQGVASEVQSHPRVIEAYLGAPKGAEGGAEMAHVGAIDPSATVGKETAP